MIFVTCYWAVRRTFEQAVVNCRPADKTVEFTVLGSKYEVTIPIMVNTVPIAKDAEIVVLKESVEQTTKRGNQGTVNQAAKKAKK